MLIVAGDDESHLSVLKFALFWWLMIGNKK